MGGVSPLVGEAGRRRHALLLWRLDRHGGARPYPHPWYLLWLLPFFCFWRIPSLVALSGTVVFAYAVWPGRLSGGALAMPTWALVAEYAPALALILWELRRLPRLRPARGAPQA